MKSKYSQLFTVPVRKPRKGSLYLLIVFIIVSVSVLAAKFFQISRQQQSSSFRLEQNLAARGLAESAQAEAYASIVMQTEKLDSDLSKWLVDKNQRGPFALALPATECTKGDLLKSNFSADIVCELKKIDFRSHSHEMVDYASPDEGQGTLAISVAVKLFHGIVSRSPSFSASLTTHHDYLIAAMISRRSNSSQRTGYSQAFPLDYVLLVRDGLNEFRDYSGNILNDTTNKLIINQESLDKTNCGKIYFGGADLTNHQVGASPPLGNYVFFNLGEDMTDAIPSPPLSKVTIGQNEILELIPDLNKAISDLSDLTSTVQGVQGIFVISTAPVLRSAYSGLDQMLERKGLDKLQQIGEMCETNCTPFSVLLGSKAKLTDDFLSAIFEGSIRKRFLYLVHFYIDLSNAVITHPDDTGAMTTSPVEQTEVDRLKEFSNRIVCLPEKAAETTENQHFLNLLNQRFSERDGVSLISHLNASHTMNFSQGSFSSPGGDYATPVFFNRKNQQVNVSSVGVSGFMPYGSFELWSKRMLKADDLVRLKIIDVDNKIIRPRGVIHISDSDGLTIGDGDWKIEGCGVLVASKIVVHGSITKTKDSDLLVLYARSTDIEINTDKRVEAALVAINNNRFGRITALKKLDLKGAIIADRLNIALWEPGEHKLEYDSAFKLANKDVYISSISKWTTFQAWVVD